VIDRHARFAPFGPLTHTSRLSRSGPPGRRCLREPEGRRTARRGCRGSEGERRARRPPGARSERSGRGRPGGGAGGRAGGCGSNRQHGRRTRRADGSAAQRGRDSAKTSRKCALLFASFVCSACRQLGSVQSSGVSRGRTLHPYPTAGATHLCADRPRMRTATVTHTRSNPGSRPTEPRADARPGPSSRGPLPRLGSFRRGVGVNRERSTVLREYLGVVGWASQWLLDVRGVQR